MRKIFVAIMVVLLSGSMMVPQVEAQSRMGGRQGSSSTHNVASGVRPGRSGSAGGSNIRPGSGSNASNNSGNGKNSSVGTRPGGGSSSNFGNGYRPGGSNNDRPTGGNYNQGGSNNRPGGYNAGNRPGNGGSGKADKPSNGNRPGVGDRPSNGGYDGGRQNHPGGANFGGGGHGWNYGSRPGTVRPGGNAGSRRPTLPPAYRAERMPIRSWSRPVPPSGWRPARRVHLFGDILGLTFGVAFNTALDYLYNNGYTVDGYGAEQVYLRNVTEVGYYWDDATMYFNNGYLVRSEFYESTDGFDFSRYNSVYSTLCSRYGSPVSHNRASSSMSATWFDYSGQYVSLEFAPMSTSNGFRYFTILTYGK